jgi:predicted kinase
MALLTITRGLPGSGKTAMARKYVAGDPGRRARVNRDDLRAMLHGRRLGTSEQETAVTTIQHAAVRGLLAAGWDVVVDDTNLNPAHAAAFVELAASVGAGCRTWDLTHVPLEECIRRDLGRVDTAGYVGEQVIRGMHSRYLEGPAATG